jgi:phage gp46-like protein
MASDLFLKDLKLTRRSFDQQVSDRDHVDLISFAGGDLQTVSSRSNLMQAIINRLFTRKGELAKLGHPEYGSRLHRLVGELNNIRIKGLAELYIRQSLSGEPRVAEIIEISFSQPSRGDDRTMLKTQISLKPAGSDEPLTLVIPISLEG